MAQGGDAGLASNVPTVYVDCLPQNGLDSGRQPFSLGIAMHVFIETQKEWMRESIPPFRPGDTVRVNVRVKEGEKERLQAFEGVCIARRGAGVSETFTVRKISNGVGVERIFPVHSPMLAEITVVRRGRVRRAKLYYLRNLVGKATRIREKKTRVAVPASGTPAAG